MAYAHRTGAERHVFADLRRLLACASPERSGDRLAGVAADSARQRVAAQRALAEVPLRDFLQRDAAVPYEDDAVTRLILDTHDAAAFAPVAHLTVGGLRDWLLSDLADGAALAALAPGLTPEMAAAVSKLCRLQDLVAVARKCEVRTRFRGTLGGRGRLATRLQPNHPTDDARGIAASLLDGLLHGAGDAVIGINPATDNGPQVMRLLQMLDEVIARHAIPTQSCVLAHVTTTLKAIERGAPVDLVFQSIGGTEGTNRAFGIDLALLAQAREAALSLRRGAVFPGADGPARQVMYFETGQGSALSAGAHHACDQQTLEARAYGVARRFDPLLVNSVVGFIGPEYLFDGKQIVRAGLEDHFCGKLLGLPMGVDVCHTLHTDADGDDMDALLTLLGVAGCNFVMGVPGADDIMLAYQSTSFHDALVLRRSLGLRPAPEFEAWLERMGVFEPGGTRRLAAPGVAPGGRPALPPAFAASLQALDAEGVGGGATPGAQVGHGPQGAGLSCAPIADDAVADPARALSRPDAPSAVTPMPWGGLRRFTAARIALGRAGHSLPTAPQLEMRAAQAAARDALHQALDTRALADALAVAGHALHVLHSAAADRAAYLRRPDLGRRLDEPSRAALAGLGASAAGSPGGTGVAEGARSPGPGAFGPSGGSDGSGVCAPSGASRLVFVVADGLSAPAVQRSAAALVAATCAALTGDDPPWAPGPVVAVLQGRVAVGDEVGQALRAAAVAVLIGERPGASAADGMGVYLTWAPRVGRSDAERNCISNVRPGGATVADAARQLARLLRAARRLGATGVSLKDEHDTALDAPAHPDAALRATPHRGPAPDAPPAALPGSTG